MSDFFYKEKLGPMFSPVIKVKQGGISPTVVSAIDNLLSPAGNMFTRAETVRNLMKIENLNLEETAKALSIKMSDVANKLRLLEFSPSEREAVIKYGFTENSALEFLQLDKLSRLYAMEYCHNNEYSAQQIQGYVEGMVDSKNAVRNEVNKKLESVRKFVVNDIGFLFNSIENILRIAKNAGFEVENEKSETGGFYDIHIRVKKQGHK